ncbi:site-specific DNA-methyltransferase [Vibrio diabolicus]|uniref:site-specific DNA-methyltransferase n=1 Tax=Vibrio harveyi group TaxID=717610 RepID=UPI000793B60D|nr:MULTISPECIES: site-specific DNA-methyltransferase [Vibrio harveyi group]KXZ34530.1 DNA methylase N-4 [Vibrio alginolyticus]MCS0392593.1 site-specific DNA-methyltransferase [Vibrio diabolicus]HAS8440961.1 site-specific DNA-methyltransferase [Vibrio vulnificus]
MKITNQDKSSKSYDLINENIESLKKIFPNVVHENRIDFEALKLELGSAVENKNERFGFIWPEKDKCKQLALKPSTATLRPMFSVTDDLSDNLYIEGDNLEVLKVLQRSYHKKVDVIYIDPPYNTGRDFIYPDNFKDNVKNYLQITGQIDSEGNATSSQAEKSGRYHSNWLNMMYPRLKLARNLLSDEGVIFISIDDTEQSNLKSICDEIFGEDNFVNNIIWQKKYSPSNDAKWLSDNHDFILCYAKNKSIWRPNLLPRTDKQNSAYTNRDNDSRGDWKASDLSVKTYSAANDYEIITPSGRVVTPPAGACWRVSRTKFDEMVSDNRIWFGETGNNVPAIKRFLSEVKQGITPLTLWTYQEVGHNQTAKQELKKLFPETKDIFDTPKPVSLIKRILEIGSKKDSIVLDFFAGSGTTAQAVIEKNIEDNGHRKFILVQIPEETGKKDFATISDFTQERIKRVCKQNNLKPVRIFKLDETNIRPWDADFDNLEQVLQQATKSIKDGRSSEDVLCEIFLKYGYDLSTPVETEIKNGKTVYVAGAGALIVCLDDEITTETVEGIAKLKVELDPETTQVVFKDEGFSNDIVKTNAIQILKQAGIEDVKSI